MPQLFTNNAWGTLASQLDAGATSLALSTGQGARFPSPTGGDYFLLTLIGVTGTTETSWEIVKCTARSTDTLTIARAQEGTSDATWALGTRVELRVTAAPLADLGQITTLAKTDSNFIVGDGSKWVAESGATARTSLGLGTAATTASTDYAPAAKGVTNGDSHNHDGGDGAQIAYSALSGLPTLGTAAAMTGPSGTIVGTTDSQTLTNKTLTDPAIIGAIAEDVYTISDGAAFEIDPGNGTIQLITLGASRTPKATNFAAGESVTLMVLDGSAYTLTWTDATFGGSGVVWVGGTAPTLDTTKYTVIELWKVGTQVYGALVGAA
jgi:hypothetical protein